MEPLEAETPLDLEPARDCRLHDEQYDLELGIVPVYQLKIILLTMSSMILSW